MSSLGERVIGPTPTIDTMQREVEEKAILTIARRQPMAVDLREIVGAMRVGNDLERIGDHRQEYRPSASWRSMATSTRKSSFAASSTWPNW